MSSFASVGVATKRLRLLAGFPEHQKEKAEKSEQNFSHWNNPTSLVMCCAFQAIKQKSERKIFQLKADEIIQAGKQRKIFACSEGVIDVLDTCDWFEFYLV